MPRGERYGTGRERALAFARAGCRNVAIYHLVLADVVEAQKHFGEASCFFYRAALQALEPRSETVTHRFLEFSLAVSSALLSGDKEQALQLARHPLEQHPQPNTGARVVGEGLYMGLANPYLIRQQDDLARPYLAKIMAMNPKNMVFPSRALAAMALIERDVSTFKEAIADTLARHHKRASNPQSSEHGLPGSFICFPALELAALAVWRGLVPTADLPERKATLNQKTWRRDGAPQVPFELNVDFLPQVLLSTY